MIETVTGTNLCTLPLVPAAMRYRAGPFFDKNLFTRGVLGPKMWLGCGLLPLDEPSVTPHQHLLGRGATLFGCAGRARRLARDAKSMIGKHV